MSAGALRFSGVVVGVGTAVVCGFAAGGLWWIAVAVGAVASVGGTWDRQIAMAQVLVALTLVVAVVGAGHDWLVVVLAAGTVVSIELAAAADRTSLVRTRVPALAQVARIAPAAAGLSAAVLVVGRVSEEAPALAPVLAAVAALVAIRVIAR